MSRTLGCLRCSLGVGFTAIVLSLLLRSVLLGDATILSTYESEAVSRLETPTFESEVDTLLALGWSPLAEPRDEFDLHFRAEIEFTNLSTIREERFDDHSPEFLVPFVVSWGGDSLSLSLEAGPRVFEVDPAEVATALSLGYEFPFEVSILARVEYSASLLDGAPTWTGEVVLERPIAEHVSVFAESEASMDRELRAEEALCRVGVTWEPIEHVSWFAAVGGQAEGSAHAAVAFLGLQIGL